MPTTLRALLGRRCGWLQPPPPLPRPPCARLASQTIGMERVRAWRVFVFFRVTRDAHAACPSCMLQPADADSYVNVPAALGADAMLLWDSPDAHKPCVAA